MDAGTTTALILEAGKLALMAYFTTMKMVGKSDDEIRIMFMTELTKCKERLPKDLPDV